MSVSFYRIRHYKNVQAKIKDQFSAKEIKEYERLHSIKPYREYDLEPCLRDFSKNSVKLSATTHAIISVGIPTLEMLDSLLLASAREVERESKALTENFTKHIPP